MGIVGLAKLRAAVIILWLILVNGHFSRPGIDPHRWALSSVARIKSTTRNQCSTYRILAYNWNIYFINDQVNTGGIKMTTEDPIKLEIEILAKDTTEEDLDMLTRNLLKELRETDVTSANLVSIGTAPEGSKGDPVTIGTLALEALPAVLPSCYRIGTGLGYAWARTNGKVQRQGI